MTNINVGMGEIKTSNTPNNILIAPGLGSCIGITMYDNIKKIAGMAHVVLPSAKETSGQVALLGKYADTAIPEMIAKMKELGAQTKDIEIKMVGGAQMFNLERGGNILNIGMRNILAVKTAIEKEKLKISASDTGGNKGRTLKLNVETGTVLVKILGQKEIEL